MVPHSKKESGQKNCPDSFLVTFYNSDKVTMGVWLSICSTASINELISFFLESRLLPLINETCIAKLNSP